MKRSTFETDPQPHGRTKTEAKLDLPAVSKSSKCECKFSGCCMCEKTVIYEKAICPFKQ
jgi:hypothetical protein